MKRLLILSSFALLAVSCHKEPYSQDIDGEYLVYTSPAKNVQFTDYNTFNIADSVLVIGQKDKPFYSQSVNARNLILAYRTNMEKLGYVYLPSDTNADLGIQLTYIERTERYVQYYDDPYWWLDYPGYWPAGYWGNWTGWYYPYPVTYSYTTNALVADMVDLMTSEQNGKLKIIWSCYIGGPASSSIKYDVERMGDAVDQAFAQSPYLKQSNQ